VNLNLERKGAGNVMWETQEAKERRMGRKRKTDHDTGPSIWPKREIGRADGSSSFGDEQGKKIGEEGRGKEGVLLLEIETILWDAWQKMYLLGDGTTEKMVGELGARLHFHLCGTCSPKSGKGELRSFPLSSLTKLAEKSRDAR